MSIDRPFIISAALLALLLPFAVTHAAHAQSVEHPARLIQKLDTNHDGALDPTEFRTARNDKFDVVDTNEDDVISRSEYEIVVARFRALHGLDRDEEQGTQNSAQNDVFDRVDADGDDRVTRDEFNAAADRMFIRLDANADGLLTVDDGFSG
jgi:Ca2+-binding EF-hand superfamily protein